MSVQHPEDSCLESAEKFRIVLVTAPSEEVAAQLARGLVERGLAACVNRIGGVRSTFSWKGEIEEEGEVLLLVKTLAAHLESCAAWLRTAHPYEVPEFVVLGPMAVEAAYAAWWEKACALTDSGDGG